MQKGIQIHSCSLQFQSSLSVIITNDATLSVRDFWHDIENKWFGGGGCRKNILLNKSAPWEDIVKG